jgi:hypothetical protein
MGRVALATTALVAATLAQAAIAASTTRPILAGPWSQDQTGYGQAEPRVINNGGDPTGVVTRIHWNTWGGPRAIGAGTGWYVGPNSDVVHGHYEAARIVLFHLGTCKGRLAYDAIEWYFPDRGQHFVSGDYIDACTGAYYTNGKPDIPSSEAVPAPAKPSTLYTHASTTTNLRSPDEEAPPVQAGAGGVRSRCWPLRERSRDGYAATRVAGIQVWRVSVRVGARTGLVM